MISSSVAGFLELEETKKKQNKQTRDPWSKHSRGFSGWFSWHQTIMKEQLCVKLTMTSKRNTISWSAVVTIWPTAVIVVLWNLPRGQHVSSGDGQVVYRFSVIGKTNKYTSHLTHFTAVCGFDSFASISLELYTKSLRSWSLCANIIVLMMKMTAVKEGNEKGINMQ